MKTETTEYFKVSRNTGPKRERVSKREAWEHKAQSGKALRDRVREKQNFKMLLTSNY